MYSYREQVERGQIKVSLSGTWSAILYDKSMVVAGDELTGLFRSETLLRVCVFLYHSFLIINLFWMQCGIAILCGPSAGCRWVYPEPNAWSFAASQKESNAEINGINKITPEMIAYISTLVCSLCCCSTTKVQLTHYRPCFLFMMGHISLMIWVV